MKCSASPTTCTADNVAAARDAVARFEGMMFAQLLHPLEKALGPFGGIASARLGTALARAHSGGLAEVIVEMLRRQGAIE